MGAFTNDALRREVLRSADQGVGLEAFLAAPEVHKFGVPSEVQHDILRLQIAVHDGAAVEIFQCQRDAASEKPWLYMAGPNV